MQKRDRVLRLSLLAPDIINEILEGQQPAELQMGDILRRFPILWDEQRSLMKRRLPHSSYAGFWVTRLIRRRGEPAFQ